MPQRPWTCDRKRDYSSTDETGRRSSAAGSPGWRQRSSSSTRGHEVELHEARPTLGGAVQTLPEREGDPPPPPDNGQHIGLGCFTEWLRFLERVGKAGAVRREPLRLPVIDERGKVATIGPGLRLLGYSHLPLASRVRIARAALRQRGQTPAAVSDRTFADVLGARPEEIDRFWDVFIRPALNLPTRRPAPTTGVFTVQTALLAGARASDLLLPVEPLGEMHGAAAGRALGDRVRLDSRVERLDDLDADAVIVAVPPPEAARLLGREPRRSRTRRSSASTCSSTGRSSSTGSPRCSTRRRTGSSTEARSPATSRPTGPVSDGGRERRPRSARGPRQGPRRDDGRRAD